MHNSERGDQRLAGAIKASTSDLPPHLLAQCHLSSNGIHPTLHISPSYQSVSQHYLVKVTFAMPLLNNGFYCLLILKKMSSHGIQAPRMLFQQPSITTVCLRVIIMCPCQQCKVLIYSYLIVGTLFSFGIKPYHVA